VDYQKISIINKSQVLLSGERDSAEVLTKNRVRLSSHYVNLKYRGRNNPTDFPHKTKVKYIISKIHK
jgi:hypothetical protein